ncbi:hypothetical protein FSOLCH5_004324 [Fusarium solani]|uniref:Protein Asterix n=3 Tax=Fusarium solani species complex TaxID=232080 RepID=A0A9P9KZU8_FUSSL|nr:uncharacterized protein B0J15DRAFT_216266 [Fusarium solani]XP_052916210.1 hypothetical protein NCS57_00407500 [Fusarium keratoplasticum]KAI8682943.1 hypothetical protein NCS56_00418000 [Fusarium sp. Ph1]KAH7271451.1 hypothetical protein B0J15DRAFT_216266 [Fusarium solani]KAI8675078.1 hypothetical protein NCS57_00407500 [Fusarium keratoplasticum]KAI8681534.1 hypothetical protein NCS55_00405200 [Fusarium keratoplasticum]KAJ3467223.1 hypothetical protein MRS44_004787 [Fusarium solani]
MAPTKDARRADLIVPYQEPKATGDSTDFSSTMSTTLPMAAMFTRNKLVGWAAVVFSIQSWLGESEESKKNSTTPGYFSVGMSIMSLAVTYLPMFLPPPGARSASGTEAPAPVPVA